MTNTALSSDTTLTALGTVCHVVEVNGAYALVHASPAGVAGIIGLGLTVSPSKRGGEYYAVRIAKSAPAPTATVVTAAPVVAPTTGTASSIRLGGSTYEIVETPTKRKVDVRRWELSKGDGSKPYVVTFQDHDGESTACSCKGGIFHKHCKHMDGVRAAYGRKSAAA
jgi:hypothetical protein